MLLVLPPSRQAPPAKQSLALVVAVHVDPDAMREQLKKEVASAMDELDARVTKLEEVQAQHESRLAQLEAKEKSRAALPPAALPNYLFQW